MKSDKKSSRNRKRLVPSVELKQTVCDVSQLADGEILDNRYELKGELGRGGMGIVHRAFDRELEMEVAIKILPPELANSKRAIKDLKSEAKLAMVLHHPSIVALYHFAHTGSVKYLVMELLTGQTLEEKLQEEEILELSEVVSIVSQLAVALDYAHSKMVVHRDIKPDNIFIHEENGKEQIRLMDFGIARQIKESMTRLTKQDSSGTILYMAPEQMEGNAVDGRADIYALGATVYECLAGTPPFYRGSISHQIATKAPEPIDDIPDKFNDALMIALAKHAEDRYATASDFATALESAMSEELSTKIPPAIDEIPPTADETPSTADETPTTADETPTNKANTPVSEDNIEFIMDEPDDPTPQDIESTEAAVSEATETAEIKATATEDIFTEPSETYQESKELPPRVRNILEGSSKDLDVDGPEASVNVWKSSTRSVFFIIGLLLSLFYIVFSLVATLLFDASAPPFIVLVLNLLFIVIPILTIAYGVYRYWKVPLNLGIDNESAFIYFNRDGEKSLHPLTDKKSRFTAIRAKDSSGGFLLRETSEDEKTIIEVTGIRLSNKWEASNVANKLNQLMHSNDDSSECTDYKDPVLEEEEERAQLINTICSIIRYLTFGSIAAVIPFLPLSQKWIERFISREVEIPALIFAIIASLAIALGVVKLKYVKSYLWMIVSTVVAFGILNLAIVYIVIPVLDQLVIFVNDESIMLGTAIPVIIAGLIILKLLPTGSDSLESKDDDSTLQRILKTSKFIKQHLLLLTSTGLPGEAPPAPDNLFTRIIRYICYGLLVNLSAFIPTISDNFVGFIMNNFFNGFVDFFIVSSVIVAILAAVLKLVDSYLGIFVTTAATFHLVQWSGDSVFQIFSPNMSDFSARLITLTLVIGMPMTIIIMINLYNRYVKQETVVSITD